MNIIQNAYTDPRDSSIYNDLNYIANSYGISELSLETKAGGLSTNNHFAMADGVKIFIKQFKSSELQKIKKIEDVTIILSNNAIPTPIFRLNRQNQSYTKISNYSYVLYPNVEGNILHGTDFNDDSLNSIAFNLAKLHQVKSKFNTVLPTTMQKLTSFEQINSEAKDIYSLLAQIEGKFNAEKEIVAKLVLKKLKFIKQSNFVFKNNLQNSSLVHGDFHNENIIISNDASVAVFLDFEMLHYGDPIEDVINFVQLACCNNGFNLENLNLARLFLSKYQLYNKAITKHTIAAGVEFYIYKMCSSFFLERTFCLSENNYLLGLLERDLNKLDFFEKKTQWVIDQLCA